MVVKHFYGNYEIVEEQSPKQYVATIKLHNLIKKVIVEADALQLLGQKGVSPETIVHNIIKTPHRFKDRVVVVGADLEQYLD